MSTELPAAVEILTAWLETPLKSPCPASGDSPWPQEIDSFLDDSLEEMKRIPNEESSKGCPLCFSRKRLDFDSVEMMPGAEMKIVRESPTSAIVRFKAGSVEPAHHHSFGHDVVVMKGRIDEEIVEGEVDGDVIKIEIEAGDGIEGKVAVEKGFGSWSAEGFDLGFFWVGEGDEAGAEEVLEVHGGGEADLVGGGGEGDEAEDGEGEAGGVGGGGEGGFGMAAGSGERGERLLELLG